MHTLPTREEAITKTQALIDGVLSDREVGDWASQLLYPDSQDMLNELERQDPLLAEFLTDTLGLAGETNPDGSPLYGKGDYQEWLDEFKAAIEAEA